jgi:sodium/hydrogen antiporter
MARVMRPGAAEGDDVSSGRSRGPVTEPAGSSRDQGTGGCLVTASTVAVVGLLLLGWATVSDVLARRNLTGPLVFVAAGYLLANPTWGPFPVSLETASVHVVAEAALALVLFADASRVNVSELRRDRWLPVRLLTIGLVLSMLIGGLLSSWLVHGLPWALAAFVGAALAPTDAALSVQLINDQRISTRLRRALNVESGLNDGIATPIVTVALALAASQLGITGDGEGFAAGSALRELAIGAAVGLVLGLFGAWAVTQAARRDWAETGALRLAVLATATSAFALTLALDGNGFIAAFVAGIAFGAVLSQDVVDLESATELPELGGELLALVVWFLFGAGLVPVAFSYLDLPLILYAVASLTVVRMVPVALALVGAGLDRPSVLFVGWFGPRGLASVVFALLAAEELGTSSPVVGQAVAAVALTVLLSVILHGISAGPGGRRYVQRENAIGATALRARPSSFASPGGVRSSG